MKLCNIGHNFDYETEKLVRVFMPFEKIEIVRETVEGDNTAVCLAKDLGETVLLRATLNLKDRFVEFSDTVSKCDKNFSKECERRLAVCLYSCFVEITGYNAPWGILTGVRPAKLFSRLRSSLGDEQAESYFKDNLLVSQEKMSLCRETSASEEKIIRLSSDNSFSLYISVPFCPTRCSYCSFVSHSVESAKKLIPEYVKLLCEEIKRTGEIAKDFNLKLETVYVGGGTPTTLSAKELNCVLDAVESSFDLSSILEYTVEAGRPDTVTKEKLEAIKKHNVTRISINPQTLNDEVLKKIGRNHTAKQMIDAFYLARELGFNNINTDLIAGLPDDTLDSFKSTLDGILRLNPENVTVHSLSMKRASKLSVSGELPEIETGKTAMKMVDYSRRILTDNGIMPYYMYRQSKTVGNLENVGYAKKGFEGLYNVYIMDETHTILGCGASAVTKLKQPHGTKIERIFNFKYPFEYINRFDELMLRKDGIIGFYKEL